VIIDSDGCLSVNCLSDDSLAQVIRHSFLRLKAGLFEENFGLKARLKTSTNVLL
jgi:hypothetical protein